MTDIVERLKTNRCAENAGCGVMRSCACADMDDTADEITRLRSERDRLRDAIKAAHFLLAWRYQEWIAPDALPERGFWLATDLRTEARNMMDAGEQELFDAIKEPHVLAALSDTENTND